MALNEKDKKLYFLIMPICAAVLITLIVIIVIKKKGEGNQTQQKQEAFLELPDVNADTTSYGKLDGYKRLEEQGRVDKKEKSLMKEKDFFGFEPDEEQENINENNNGRKITSLTNGNEKEQEILPVEEEKPAKKNTAKKNTSSTQREVIVKEKIVYVEKPTQQAPQKEEPVEEVYYNSFSVYNSNNTSTTKGSQEEEVYLKGMLQDDNKMKNGSQVSFIAREDFKTKQGITVKKQAIMYGYVTFNSDNINVTVNKVRQPDGNIVTVSLTGYNENYQKGIKYEGKVDEAVRGGSNSALDGAIDAATSANTGARVLNGVIKGATKSLDKEQEVFIQKGYIMYFK